MGWPLNLKNMRCKFYMISLQGFLMATKDLLKLSSDPLKFSLKYVIHIQLKNLEEASIECSLSFSVKILDYGFCL